MNNNMDINDEFLMESNLTLTDIFANERCLKKNQCLRKRKNQCFSNERCKLMTKVKLNKRNKKLRINMDDNRGFFIWKTTKLVKQILQNNKKVFFFGAYTINKYLFINLLKYQYLIQFFFKVKLKIKLNKTKKNIWPKKKEKILLLSKIQYLFSPLKRNIKIKKFNNEISKNKLIWYYKKLYLQYNLTIKKYNEIINKLVAKSINQMYYNWWFFSDWSDIKSLIIKNKKNIFTKYILNFYEKQFNLYLNKHKIKIFLKIKKYLKLINILIRQKNLLLLNNQVNKKHVKFTNKLKKNIPHKWNSFNKILKEYQYLVNNKNKWKQKTLLNLLILKKNNLNYFFFNSFLHKLIDYNLVILKFQIIKKKRNLKNNLVFFLLKKCIILLKKKFIKNFIFISIITLTKVYYFLNKKNTKLLDSYLIKIKEIKQMRTLRYVKYLLYKESNIKKNLFIDKTKSYLFLDHENTFIIDPIYIKKKKIFLKTIDLTFWGIENNKEIKNKFIFKNKKINKLIYWFSIIERRIDNILIRSNLLNNIYFIRSCLLNNNILVNKNIIKIYTYLVQKWDIISLPNYIRFLLFKLLLKRLKYKNYSKYKKFIQQRVKELSYYKRYKDKNFKTIRFKFFKVYSQKKKKRDYNKLPNYKLLLLNYPKYLELNYQLFLCILLKENLNKKDFNKPFSANTLAFKNNIVLYFNIINNRIYRKNKIKKKC